MHFYWRGKLINFLWPRLREQTVKFQEGTLRKSNMACCKMDYKNQWCSWLSPVQRVFPASHGADYRVPTISRCSMVLEYWPTLPQKWPSCVAKQNQHYGAHGNVPAMELLTRGYCKLFILITNYLGKLLPEFRISLINQWFPHLKRTVRSL